MKKASFLILIIVLALSACNPQKYCAKHCPSSQDTTIITHTVVHDSIVEKIVEVPVPADSASVRAKLNCDSLGNVYIVAIDSIRNGKHAAAPQLFIRDNYLTAECKVDSFAVYAAVKEKYHSEETDSTSKITNTIYVPQYIKVSEPFIPFVAKVFMWIGIGFTIVQILKKSYKAWKKKSY